MRAFRSDAIGLVAVAVASIACSPSPASTTNPATVGPSPATSATPSPMPSPSATAEPEPTEPATATPGPSRGSWAQSPPTPLLMNAAVRVLVPELNLRERPGLGATIRGPVTRNDILLVHSPPFEADGYVWYAGITVSVGKLPPLPADPRPAVGEPLSGWFAATKGDVAYVSRLEPRCPTNVDLLTVAAMLEAERLACFGERSIELEGTFGCPGCSVELTGTYEPAWLAYPNPDILWNDPRKGSGTIAIKFSPTGPDHPPQGAIVRVRGHFRDVASSDCALAIPYPWELSLAEPPSHDLPAIVARQLCRQQFVVDSYDVLGIDPRFGN